MRPSLRGDADSSFALAVAGGAVVATVGLVLETGTATSISGCNLQGNQAASFTSKSFWWSSTLSSVTDC